MSRNPRYPEPDSELVNDLIRAEAVLIRIASGELPQTPAEREDLLTLIQLHLQCAGGGELDGTEIEPSRRLAVIEPHLKAALRAGNDSLAALLTLAVWWSHEWERHANLHAEEIRAQQRRGRESAEKRKSEGNTIRTFIEAFEQEHGELDPKSKDLIEACARASEGKYEYSTIYQELCRRKRERDTGQS